MNFTGSNVFPPAKTESRLAPHSRRDLISARSLSQPVTLTTCKSSLHQLHQVTIYTLLNTPHDWSGTMKQLRRLYAQTFFTFRTILVYYRLVMHGNSNIKCLAKLDLSINRCYGIQLDSFFTIKIWGLFAIFTSFAYYSEFEYENDLTLLKFL